MYATSWLVPHEQEETIEQMLRYGIVRFDNNRNLPLKSGGKTDVYINLRDARNNPEAVGYFARLFAHAIQRTRANRFAEVPQAVSCFSGIIAEKTGLPMVTIRDQEKQGRVSSADIIGTINFGDRIAIFDDVITDGASKLAGYHACKRRGASPFQLVLVDRQQGWQAVFEQNGIDMPVWAGMTLHDVRRYLIENGMMQRCDPKVEAQNPLIVALDGRSWNEILPIIDVLRTTGTILKVNDLAIDIAPTELIRNLSIYGRVMMDLKCHDIPNTVGNVCRRLRKTPPWAVTAHASDCGSLIKAAVEELKGTGTKVLAITVLTSMNRSACKSVFGRTPKGQVAKLAEIAAEAGADGFVCSPEENKMLADLFPKKLVVTPGIRSAGVDSDDQARVATPSEAIKHSTHLVMGRQVFGADDPVAEIARLQREELGIR